MGRELNTVKYRNIIDKLRCIPENEDAINFESDDLEGELDSTVLVRERVKGSKLETSFSKKAPVLDESEPGM